MEANERIICALDLHDPEGAFLVVRELDGLVNFFKVGMLLYLVDGKRVVERLLAEGKKVFLDLKFYDVPDTVGPAVKQAAKAGVNFLTVHGNREMLQRAGDAAGPDLKVLAVTVLTSLDESDLREMGYTRTVEELVLERARQAVECGCAGVIASPREVRLLREHLGPGPLVVTPGIRPAGSVIGTHKRSAAPGEAVRAGANYLVIGQPIINAPDRRQAAIEIIEDINR